MTQRSELYTIVLRLLAFSLLILHKIAKEFESGIISQQKVTLRI
ncbi:hypothetical protein [uncultured Gammaproteobacteria bacterium]|nr:hypothetical protein [uncultured Gammaproteobacteria bacterium]